MDTPNVSECDTCIFSQDVYTRVRCLLYSWFNLGFPSVALHWLLTSTTAYFARILNWVGGGHFCLHQISECVIVFRKFKHWEMILIWLEMRISCCLKADIILKNASRRKMLHKYPNKKDPSRYLFYWGRRILPSRKRNKSIILSLDRRLSWEQERKMNRSMSLNKYFMSLSVFPRIKNKINTSIYIVGFLQELNKTYIAPGI